MSGVQESDAMAGSKFVKYGCWCFQNERGIKGFGQPRDDIDRSCLKMNHCSHCLNLDFGDRCHHGRAYSFTTEIRDSERELICLDDPITLSSACRRSLCECDKRLAESLTTYSDSFDLASSSQ